MTWFRYRHRDMKKALRLLSELQEQQRVNLFVHSVMTHSTLVTLCTEAALDVRTFAVSVLRFCPVYLVSYAGAAAPKSMGSGGNSGDAAGGDHGSDDNGVVAGEDEDVLVKGRDLDRLGRRLAHAHVRNREARLAV